MAPNESLEGGINKILQILRRDDKSSTYKFALLRGLVEILDREPFLALERPHAEGNYPLGLLIERWLYYYIPLIRKNCPQAPGDRVAFKPALEKALSHYPKSEGISDFHHDYRRGRINGAAARDFSAAAIAIAKTLTKMPMKHLGYSAEQGHYSVTKPERTQFKRLNCEIFDEAFLRRNFGTFSIDASYLAPLRGLGALIIGTESILQQWAEFSSSAATRAGRRLPPEEVITILASRPSDERDVKEAREAFLAILKRGEPLLCVWCGEPIKGKDDLAVDHVIPFSLWGDNSRANLMPVHARENNRKRDKIPSPELIERSRERLIFYLRPDRRPNYAPSPSGHSEIHDAEDVENNWVSALKERCRRIIEDRGYQSWQP